MTKIAHALLVTAMAGGMAVASATGASAAHCVEGDTPGFSYFGTDHAQETDRPQGSRTGPNGGTQGASNCNETTGNPSERAPGKAE